jgi:hypothetical protein
MRFMTVEQMGVVLIPDGVTTILNLMTGMGLLGVAAVVRAAFLPIAVSQLPVYSA